MQVFEFSTLAAQMRGLYAQFLQQLYWCTPGLRQVKNSDLFRISQYKVLDLQQLRVVLFFFFVLGLQQLGVVLFFLWRKLRFFPCSSSPLPRCTRRRCRPSHPRPTRCSPTCASRAAPCYSDNTAPSVRDFLDTKSLARHVKRHAVAARRPILFLLMEAGSMPTPA